MVLPEEEYQLLRDEVTDMILDDVLWRHTVHGVLAKRLSEPPAKLAYALAEDILFQAGIEMEEKD